MSYLFDTSFISHLLDPERAKHQEAFAFVSALSDVQSKYISVIAMAELRYGLEMAIRLGNGKAEKVEAVIAEAEKHSPLGIGQHTSVEYARLKSLVALKYMPNKLRTMKKKKGFHGWPEEWSDEVTGKKLGIQENDLWQCAQAIERGLEFVTADQKMERINIAAGGTMTMIVI